MIVLMFRCLTNFLTNYYYYYYIRLMAFFPGQPG